MTRESNPPAYVLYKAIDQIDAIIVDSGITNWEVMVHQIYNIIHHPDVISAWAAIRDEIKKKPPAPEPAAPEPDQNS